MTVFQLLQTLNIPVVYGRHTDRVVAPYLMVTGSGQDYFAADNTYYTRENRYTVEYYFKTKDPTFETAIENLLLENGYRYEKSEDLYLDDEKVFFIYYDI